MRLSPIALAAAALAAGAAAADGRSVAASDQDVSDGVVVAERIVADANGWMVVHRTPDGSKPGPVVGHAPVMAGENAQVVAILTEPVASGQKLMLMLHGEEGGRETGVFEYTLGASEDGPVKRGGELVMAVVTAE